ncbi:hypothetical protein [Achromobacter xylosoxidans]|uniref:hypothetical protein n=1 Tax=Alcaligenes xylosoxydans xylosoxydans TaxID=85698 RepID=UPI0038FC8B2E
MTTLYLPQNLSLINAINFCNRMWREPIGTEVIFDCGRMQHVEPFTMAYVSAEIKRFSEIEGRGVSFTNYQHHTFAAHMGFFHAAGVNFGNQPGQAKGSSTYIPLTILRTKDLEAKAHSEYEPVGNIIESESTKLAKVLLQKDDGELVDALTFSLREIMRNVVEHSQSEVLEFCAQYWPTKSKVELVVLDSGVGVKESLSKNPYLVIENDRDAIHLALMPAVSGKMFQGVKRQSNNVWQNSGFGLYMTNRLCRNGGSFFICSGQSGILLNGAGKKDLETSFSGTALRLVLNTTTIGNLATSLERYKREGYAISTKHNPKNTIEPSVASTMLSRDFFTPPPKATP